MPKKPKQLTIQEKWKLDYDDGIWNQFTEGGSKFTCADLMIDSLNFPSMSDLPDLIEYLRMRSKEDEGKKPGWSGGGGSSGGSSGGSATVTKPKETDYPGSDGSHSSEKEYFGKMSEEDMLELAETGGDKYDYQNKVISRRLGVSQDEAKKMREAVADYSSNGEYTNIRNSKEAKYKNKAKEIDKFVDKSPKFKGEVFRGVGMTEDQISSMKPGATFDMKGVSSWSSDRSISQAFADTNSDKSNSSRPVVFSMKNKSGVSITHLSGFAGESEVLHSSKSKFKVDKIEKGKDGTTNVYITEV